MVHAIITNIAFALITTFASTSLNQHKIIKMGGISCKRFITRILYLETYCVLGFLESSHFPELNEVHQYAPFRTSSQAV